jgi:transposase
MPTRDYRPWHDQEVEYVLANRQRLKLAAIARHLGRSVASVRNMLVYHGHSRRKRARAEWESALRRLHRAGKSDAEIAPVLGCARGTVQRRRVQLGLPPVAWKGWRQRYRRQMENADASNLVDLRWRPVRVARLVEGA